MKYAISVLPLNVLCWSASVQFNGQSTAFVEVLFLIFNFTETAKIELLLPIFKTYTRTHSENERKRAFRLLLVAAQHMLSRSIQLHRMDKCVRRRKKKHTNSNTHTRNTWPWSKISGVSTLLLHSFSLVRSFVWFYIFVLLSKKKTTHFWSSNVNRDLQLPLILRGK